MKCSVHTVFLIDTQSCRSSIYIIFALSSLLYQPKKMFPITNYFNACTLYFKESFNLVKSSINVLTKNAKTLHLVPIIKHQLAINLN